MDDKGRHRDGDQVTMTRTTTTKDELHQAIQAGLHRRTTERRATSVRYDPERYAIEIELTGGAAIRIPRSTIEELSPVPPAELIHLRITPAGSGIKLDRFDIAIGVHGLLASLVTTAEMASTLGKRGGAVRSDAKRETARTNGAKGGRPRKVSRVA
jgi:hypothetical protein